MEKIYVNERAVEKRVRRKLARNDLYLEIGFRPRASNELGRYYNVCDAKTGRVAASGVHLWTLACDFGVLKPNEDMEIDFRYARNMRNRTRRH